MELLYSVTSPYSAKVRMAARHLGIDITNVAVDTNAEPATLVDNHPTRSKRSRWSTHKHAETLGKSGIFAIA